MTPFVAYLPAEHLGVSGVLSVVCAGLYLGWRMPEILSVQTRLRGGPVWDMVEFFITRGCRKPQYPSGIDAGGHDGAIVSRVLGLVKRAEFKRQQAAPGLKITDRAFGTGWRMPIASQWEAQTPQPISG